MTIMICVVFASCGNEGYPAMDYRIFKGTPVWELAKAVRDNDLDKIRKVIKYGEVDINYQENTYGYTVLMCALCHESTFLNKIKLDTIQLLLELGANPNLYSGSWQRGENPVVIAASQNYADALELLLRYGGDPNSQCRRKGKWENDDTALMAAIATLHNGNDIECVRLLVENGADINAVTESNKGGALSQCFVWNRHKALLYLLHKGINYNLPIMSLGQYSKNGLLYVDILHALRDDIYEL